MKTRIGVDAVTGLTHSVAATSANVADVTMAGDLVRDDDEQVYGDTGYLGMGKYLDEEKDAPDSRCYVAAKRGAIQKTEDSPMKTLLLAIEKAKASIRSNWTTSKPSYKEGRIRPGSPHGLSWQEDIRAKK